MKIAIMRHGDAGMSIEDDDEADDLRPLTDVGERQVDAVVARMIEDDAVPRVIYSSPATRARQTALRARRAFNAAGAAIPPVLIEDGLGPAAHRGHSLSAVVRKLASDEGVKRALVVSHHDSIGRGLASLNDVQQLVIPIFAKGEARGYEVDRGTAEWEERWRVLPSDVGLDDVYGEIDV